MTAEENYRLIQEIDANRCFLLAAYRSNPHLLARADARMRVLLGLPTSDTASWPQGESRTADGEPR